MIIKHVVKHLKCKIGCKTEIYWSRNTTRSAHDNNHMDKNALGTKNAFYLVIA